MHSLQLEAPTCHCYITCCVPKHRHSLDSASTLYHELDSPVEGSCRCIPVPGAERAPCHVFVCAHCHVEHAADVGRLTRGRFQCACSVAAIMDTHEQCILIHNLSQTDRQTCRAAPNNPTCISTDCCGKDHGCMSVLPASRSTQIRHVGPTRGATAPFSLHALPQLLRLVHAAPPT